MIHWKVKDVFYGYLPSEKTSWYITINSPIVTSEGGNLFYSYLKLKNDETPNTFNRIFGEINVTAGVPFTIYLDKSTPFSLSLSSDNPALASESIDKIKALPSTGQAASKLFLDALDATIALWETYFTPTIDNPIIPPTAPPGGTVTLVSSKTFKIIPQHKLYPATNDIWGTGVIYGINDVDNPAYWKGDAYVFDRWFKLTPSGNDLENDFEVGTMPTNPYTLQTNFWVKSLVEALEPDANKTTDLTVDPPLHTLAWHIVNGTDGEKVTEIHKALDAGKFSKNEIDPAKDRVPTLGYLIEKNCSLLGHRPDANGDIDFQKEAEMRAKILNNPKWTPGDQSYSQFCFGKKGTIVKSTPISFDKNGKLLELWHVCGDIPQLFAAALHDIDKSLSIEQGSQIRTKGLNGKVIGFENKLAMDLDSQQRLLAVEDRIETIHSIVSVLAMEVRGLYPGIGIPTSIEKIPIKTASGKIKAYLPYFTHQSSQSSILGQITALKINIAIILGVLMPKASSKKTNPFMLLLGKKNQ